MACDLFAVDSVYRVSAYQVLIKGRVQADCASLRIAVVFPDGARAGGPAVVQPDSPTASRWSIVVARPDGVLSSWCKSTVDVVAAAYGPDGREICASEAKDQVLSCCPQVSSLGPQEGICRTRPLSGGALDRDVRWRLRIDWPSGVPDGTEISVSVDLTSVEDPAYSDSASAHATHPQTEATTEPLHLPSGSSWTGRLRITLPSHCTHTRDFPDVYVVPVCDAAACPLPPAGDIFLTVLDGGTTVVVDPNDTGCVSGDFLTITAQDWPGTLTWRAEVNSQTVNATPTGNPREVRVDMPPGEDRLTITAQVVVDAASGCIHSRSVTAKRCDCLPVPGGAVLQVLDDQGRPVAETACVTGAYADVVAPDHEDGVTWVITPPPAAADPPNSRTRRIPLNDDTTYTVTATIGRDRCATKLPPRTVERCRGVPAHTDTFWPRIPWCVILMFAGIVALLIGLLVLSIGVAAIASVVCWFWLASALIWTAWGPWVVMIVWMVVAIGGVIGGGVLIAIGVILLVVWLLACGGCDELKSPIPFCESLRLLLKFLQVVGVILFVLETIILGLSFVGAILCGVGVASAMAVIDVAMWLVDLGVLAALILGVEYFGNAIGCFNTAPTIWPLSMLQIKLPPPGANNLPCFDADAQIK